MGNFQKIVGASGFESWACALIDPEAGLALA